MSNNADRLLLYAKGKNKIACYGAGQFGKEVFAYLHDFGIDICLFAVSMS